MIKQIIININPRHNPDSQVLCAISCSPSSKELRYRKRAWFKVRMVSEGRTTDHSSSNDMWGQRLWQKSVDLQVGWGMEMEWLPTVPHHTGPENFKGNDPFKTKPKELLHTRLSQNGKKISRLYAMLKVTYLPNDCILSWNTELNRTFSWPPK